MLKYLRIAVTALSLTACVLLIALWVRSYWWADGISIPLSQAKRFAISSSEGYILFRCTKNRSQMRVFSSINIAEMESLMSQRDSQGRPLVTKRPHRLGLHNWEFECFHGFFVILGVLLTLVIGFGPPWRFSLRTLLIATTLVAVTMGVIIWAAE